MGQQCPPPPILQLENSGLLCFRQNLSLALRLWMQPLWLPFS